MKRNVTRSVASALIQAPSGVVILCPYAFHSSEDLAAWQFLTNRYPLVLVSPRPSRNFQAQAFFTRSLDQRLPARALDMQPFHDCSAHVLCSSSSRLRSKLKATKRFKLGVPPNIPYAFPPFCLIFFGPVILGNLEVRAAHKMTRPSGPSLFRGLCFSRSSEATCRCGP